MGVRPGARVALQLPFEQVAFAGRTGAINFLPDPDGIGRRYHVDLEAHGWLIPSLPARVVRALGGTTPAARAVDIHWRGAAGARPRRSFSDVLAALRAGEDAGVAERIVVIGSDAQGMGDVRATPLDPLQPGVEVLATLIDNSVNRSSVGEVPTWARGTILLAVMSVVSLVFVVRGLDHSHELSADELAAIERIQPGLHKRFVFITGVADDPVFKMFISKTKSPVLRKPVPIDKLLAEIKRVAGSAS